MLSQNSEENNFVLSQAESEWIGEDNSQCTNSVCKLSTLVKIDNLPTPCFKVCPSYSMKFYLSLPTSLTVSPLFI